MLTLENIGWLLAGALLPSLVRVLLLRRSIYHDDRDAIALNATCSSRWFNMGYWLPDVTSFPEAAAELCRQVAARADLSRGGRVLEVGSGYGDSAQLLLTEFPSIRSYLGVTAVPEHHRYATLRRSGLSAEFVCDDAVARTDSLAPGSLDVVLATDCAYHFNTRERWLRSAHRALSPDGRLALTDLLLPRPLSLFDQLALRIICFMASVPWQNLTTPAEYRKQLERQAWRDIHLDDISSSTYPGFLRCVETQGKELGHALTAWNGLQSYARVVRWYSTPTSPRLAFYLISARK